MPIYSDINVLPEKGKSPVVYDVEAVYQSIEHILSTKPGERLFLPDFYAELESLLMEPIDDETSFKILDTILGAIEKWENRVYLLYAECQVTPKPDEHAYDVKLVFRIRGIEGQTFEYRGVLRK